MMNIIHPNCRREKFEFLMNNPKSQMEKDKCYLCYEEATEERQFVDPNPCDCKGTIKLHSSCAQELINNSESCGICKVPWRFTGIKRYVESTYIEEYTYVDGIREGLYRKYDNYYTLLTEGN